MKRTGSKEGNGGDAPSRLIDARIKELGDWRGETLARVRTLIRQADPEVVEEWKWRGVPVWSHAGIICTGETYKNIVKMTFARGAALEDPSGLFNSSLEGNTRRAIDFHEGDKINEKALKALIRAAVALNVSAPGDRPPRRLSEETKERVRRLTLEEDWRLRKADLANCGQRRPPCHPALALGLAAGNLPQGRAGDHAT
jgi:hypothetical protein